MRGIIFVLQRTGQSLKIISIKEYYNMQDIIVRILSIFICGVIAVVMWEKEWWGKIISVIFVSAAIQGIFSSFWIFLICVVIGVIVLSTLKK